MVSLQNQSPDTAKSAGVLLVDDDPALLQALSNMLALRMRGLEVTTASSAPEALAHIQTSEFDAIICDIKMPGMDGLDLLAHVKRLQQETPVLLITGHGEHDLAIRALRGGAYDYLLKPIERDAFVAALRRALQTRKLRREVEEQQHALEQYATSLESMVEQRTAELAAANAELRTASEAKDTMLRMVTHELAGPLTSLKGMVQLLGLQLKRLSLSPQMQQSLNNIERSLNRLEMLIHDLQDTSLIQTG
ncbi:MAG: response regulator, partial [Ktedonobacteraceae bacterium]|nr:response regulator [Ktedonobacteraceae bacterium]